MRIQNTRPEAPAKALHGTSGDACQLLDGGIFAESEDAAEAVTVVFEAKRRRESGYLRFAFTDKKVDEHAQGATLVLARQPHAHRQA